MLNFTSKQLARVGSRIFEAAGVPQEIALRISRSLVESNLVGHDSHGVLRIVPYMANLREGRISLQAEIEVLRETSTMALLDAHWGFGLVAAAKAMRMAIDKARENQIAMVAIARCNHIGRLGEYPLMAAEQGLIGVTVCNTGRSSVAPFGGMARVLATNPISVAVPAGKGKPFLMDFATSMCAEGKLRVAIAKGEPVPLGWILDKAGNPTTNPEDYYEGGVILPLGQHKGYALCLLVDILGGILTGHGCSCLPEWEGGNGVIMMAIDIKAFRPMEQFEDTADRVFDRVKAVPTAPGFDEILIPGEPEFRIKEKRQREGIPVPESVWHSIVQEAEQLGLEIDELLQD